MFPETKYITIFKWRLIFRKYGSKWKYDGWYTPKLKKSYLKKQKEEKINGKKG